MVPWPCVSSCKKEPTYLKEVTSKKFVRELLYKVDSYIKRSVLLAISPFVGAVTVKFPIDD